MIHTLPHIQFLLKVCTRLAVDTDLSNDWLFLILTATLYCSERGDLPLEASMSTILMRLCNFLRVVPQKQVFLLQTPAASRVIQIAIGCEPLMPARWLGFARNANAHDYRCLSNVHGACTCVSICSPILTVINLSIVHTLHE